MVRLTLTLDADAALQLAAFLRAAEEETRSPVVAALASIYGDEVRRAAMEQLTVEDLDRIERPHRPSRPHA